jgi:hypothetical protein
MLVTNNIRIYECTCNGNTYRRTIEYSEDTACKLIWSRLERDKFVLLEDEILANQLEEVFQRILA